MPVIQQLYGSRVKLFSLVEALWLLQQKSIPLSLFL